VGGTGLSADLPGSTQVVVAGGGSVGLACARWPGDQPADAADES
jgi:hypothetical protein